MAMKQPMVKVAPTARMSRSALLRRSMNDIVSLDSPKVFAADNSRLWVPANISEVTHVSSIQLGNAVPETEKGVLDIPFMTSLWFVRLSNTAFP
jgi:hypothetical protein